MVALHWLSQVPERVRGIVHVHHGTGEFADLAEDLVRTTAKDYSLPFHYRRLERTVEEGKSLEEAWRDQRYRFFKETSWVSGCLPVVVAHTFDDCLEEYIMCTMVRGYSGTIPYRHAVCIRPFRLWKRQEILQYALNHDVPYVEDPSNSQPLIFKRAYIRHKIVPQVKGLNPGVYNIVERVIREQDKR